MFRFTIRDVLWLTVVVALATGWWVDRNGLSQALNKSRRERLETVVRIEAEQLRRDQSDWAFRKAQWEYYQQKQAPEPATDNRP
jgi:hypothetical protein